MSQKRRRLAALLLATGLTSSAIAPATTVIADDTRRVAPALSMTETMQLPQQLRFSNEFDKPGKERAGGSTEGAAIEPRVNGSQIVIPPTAAKTETRSHLQFSQPSRQWNAGDARVGSALELLPPTQPAAEPIDEPVVLGVEEPTETEPSAPRMVTRSDAKLNGFRKSWEATGPMFTQTDSPMVLRGPSDLNPEAGNSTEMLADGTPTNLPRDLDGRQAATVADRTGLPSWEARPNVAPNADGWNARRNVDARTPLADPMPQTNLGPIGSGALPVLQRPALAPPALAPPALAPPNLPIKGINELPQKVDELSSKLDSLTEQINALAAEKTKAAEALAAAQALKDKEAVLQIPPSIRSLPSLETLPNAQSLPRLDELPSLEDATMSLGNPTPSGPESVDPPKKVSAKPEPTTRELIKPKLVEPKLATPNASTPNASKSNASKPKVEKPTPVQPDAKQRMNESIAERLRRNDSRDQTSDDASQKIRAVEPKALPSESSDRDANETTLGNAKGLSTVRLQPVDQSRLKPLGDAAQNAVPLRDIRGRDLDTEDLTDLYDETEEDASSGVALRLAQLDATGRPKPYDGKGVSANLSTGVMRLQRPIQSCLQYYYQRPEQADGRSNWGMMHAIMVYGPDTRVVARGRDYSTIAWMAGNNVCRGQRLMEINDGKIAAKEGVGLQGHQAQWLAVLAMAGVPSDYPLYVDGQQFTVADLVKVEAAACADGKELTFTLIGLSHYLDTETSWVGADGEPWDFARLIAAELDQPVVGAACGGTHRLMGFAHALRKRRMEAQPVNGQWARAEQFLDDFVDYTYRIQNRDGSMSTDWFESRQDNGDLDRKVQTTGHMVEFLLTHLPDERLLEPEVLRSVTFLVNAMTQNRTNDWSIGPKGHALRTLAMFHQRVYGEAAAMGKLNNVAGQRRTNQRRR